MPTRSALFFKVFAGLAAQRQRKLPHNDAGNLTKEGNCGKRPGA